MTPHDRVSELLRQIIHADVDALAARVERVWAAGSKGQREPVALGRYELMHVLGRGSYGVVFSAFDRILERDVAVKVVYAGIGFDRVMREAQLLARVRHPHVVAVYDTTRIGPYDLIVMDLVDGDDIRRAGTRLDGQALLDCYLQVADGLAAVHRIGAVHGDVKPGNILVDLGGRAYLADFGQCRLLGCDDDERSPARGTPAYLAPERWAGEALTAASDQYALCVSVWESLFGHRPWRGPRGKLIGDGLRPHRVLPSPDLAELAEVLRRGLSAEPGDRFADIDALRAALRDAAERGGARRAS